MRMSAANGPLQPHGTAQASVAYSGGSSPRDRVGCKRLLARYSNDLSGFNLLECETHSWYDWPEILHAISHRKNHHGDSDGCKVLLELDTSICGD